MAIGQPLADILYRQIEIGNLKGEEGDTPEVIVAKRLETWNRPGSRVERRALHDGRILDIYRSPTNGGDIISIHVDVTDTVRNSEELERQRLYMQSLLDNTTDAISLLDSEGRFVMFNERLLELYDIDPKRVRWGMTYEEMASQFGDLDDLPAEEKHREIENRKSFAFAGEISTIRRKLANGRTLNINKRNLPDGGCVMTYRDITADLKREQELIDARIEAEESNRHKSEFVARMSHEMRTPLNGVLGIAALLSKSENLNEREKEMVGVIGDSGKVLLRLIDDILDLSRLDAGAFDVIKEDFELPALVHECIRIIEPSAAEKDLEIRIVSSDAPMPGLYGDPVRIKQILLNLLTNAVKFTDEGYIEVEYGCRVKRDEVLVSLGLSDTGVGIDNDKLEQIFNRFYQIDGGATRRHGGAGLGLAITQKLVEIMNGSIQVASQKGHGTTFRIKLPLGYAHSERKSV